MRQRRSSSRYPIRFDLVDSAAGAEEQFERFLQQRVLRPWNRVKPRTALGQAQRHTRRRRPHHRRRPADRQHRSYRHRSATERAHAVDQARRPASEDGWQIEPAADREGCARPASRSPNRGALQLERPVWCDAPSTGRDVETRAADGTQHVFVGIELRADERDLQRSRVAIVADEPVGQPVRVGVHRAGHGHSARLIPHRPRSCTVVSIPARITVSDDITRVLSFEFSAADRLEAHLVADVEEERNRPVDRMASSTCGR